MQNNNLTPQELAENLSLINPCDLIPVIEKGIEIESLVASPGQDLDQRIKSSRFFLCLLYRLRLRT